MTTELIDLQSANATQLSDDGVKSDWKINKNVTGETLQVFPATITDELMFMVLDFARKYELIAFNEGITFQKGKENEVLAATIAELQQVNAFLIAENSRLADALEVQYNS